MNSPTEDSEFFDIAHAEIKNKTYDEVLWRKAMALMGNNEKKVKEKYIKLRSQQLKYVDPKTKLNNYDLVKVGTVSSIADVESMTEEERRARYGKK